MTITDSVSSTRLKCRLAKNKKEKLSINQIDYNYLLRVVGLRWSGRLNNQSKWMVEGDYRLPTLLIEQFACFQLRIVTFA